MGVLTCPIPAGESQEGCSAARMWRSACATLVAPDSERAWQKIVETGPPDTVWHSLRNCVAHQAGVWQHLLSKGIDDVIQPAAFKLAIVLRHTPTDLSVRLLSDLLRLHPQSQDLTSYILALLTDDEAEWSGGGSSGSSSPGSPTSTTTGDPGKPAPSGVPMGPPAPPAVPLGPPAPSVVPLGPPAPPAVPLAPPAAPVVPLGPPAPPAVPLGPPAPPAVPLGPPATPAVPMGPPAPPAPPTPPTPMGPAPLRDLQLFGDCELAVLAASREEYDAQAKLVRAEYSKLSHRAYVQLRIKILNQFSRIPKLFHTPEFECFESAARENIEREICTLREHLLTGRPEPS